MKRTILILLLAACAALLTSCYTETDPWPETGLSGTQTAEPTAPSATMAPTAPPTAAPQPTAIPEPLPPDAVDVSPNFNG